MSTMPTIISVVPQSDKTLLVVFTDGTCRRYDCRPLMVRPDFKRLSSEQFFKTVKVDIGGHGVSWDDDLDLSEHELLANGMRLSADIATNTPA